MSFTLCTNCGADVLVSNRLQQEVEGTLGGMTEWTLDDLSRLTYMSQVIKETLRLYPVVSATAREPSQDTELNGFAVPQGTFLAVGIAVFSLHVLHSLPWNPFSQIPFTVLHHLPQYYEEPDLFKPERFDPDAERLVNSITNVFWFLIFYHGFWSDLFCRPLYAFAPFSHGQRSCLGKQFAMVSLIVQSICLKRICIEISPESW